MFLSSNFKLTQEQLTIYCIDYIKQGVIAETPEINEAL